MGGKGSGRKPNPVNQFYGGSKPNPSVSPEFILPNLSGTKHEINKKGSQITTDDLTEGSTNKYDETVTLTEGTNISITGTYPTFTISSSAESYNDTKLKLNIALNSFRITINGSLSLFNLVDGFVDEYEDETGVDTTNSSNQTYDSSGDYYENTGDDLGTGLISRWKLDDDADNSNVDDDVGGNDGTWSDGVNNYTSAGSTTGKLGKALDFDGSDDYIETSNIGNYSNITVSTWVKGSAQDGNTIVSKYDYGANERSWYIGTQNVSPYNKLFVIISDDGTLNAGHTKRYVTSEIPFDNTWHQISFTFNSSILRIYIDGVEDTAVIKSFDEDITSIYSSTTPITIGTILNNNDPGATYHFNGSIDEVRIYSRALTAEEISDLYNSGDGTESITGGTAKNMTLISETQTAEATPTTARIIILEEDVDSVTINTDIKAYASRDGGTTWDEITLADEGDFSTGIRILTGDVDLTSTGTSIKYKLTTHNTKGLKIHGTALLWD